MQRGSLSLFGIPVTVSAWHFLWMFVLLYNVDTAGLGMPGTLLLILLASASVLLHELGHAAVAKAFKLDPEIYLVSLGGITRHAPPRQPWHQFAIALAGPLMNFLLAVVFYVARDLLPLAAESVTGWVIGINIVWGIYNLLPVWPMDGGQLMGVVFRKIFKGLLADRLTYGVSVATAVVVGLLLLRGGSIIGGMFLAMAALQNWRMLQGVNESPNAKAQRKHGRVRELIGQARQAFERGDFPAATQLGHLARNEPYLSQEELDHIWHLLALAEARLGNVEQACRYAQRLPTSADMAAVQAFALARIGDVARIRQFLASPAALLLPAERVEALQELARAGGGVLLQPNASSRP